MFGVEDSQAQLAPLSKLSIESNYEDGCFVQVVCLYICAGVQVYECASTNMGP